MDILVLDPETATEQTGCWVTVLTENKTKPASWGLAELGYKLSRVGVFAEDML